MATTSEVAGLFAQMAEQFDASKAGDTQATIQFDLSGEGGGKYWVKIADGTCETAEGEMEDAQMTLSASADDYLAIASGQLNPMQAFMTGKVKVKGDMGLAMKMQSIFNL